MNALDTLLELGQDNSYSKKTVQLVKDAAAELATLRAALAAANEKAAENYRCFCEMQAERDLQIERAANERFALREALSASQAREAGLRLVIRKVYCLTQSNKIEHLTANALGHKAGCTAIESSEYDQACDCGGVDNAQPA